MALEKLLLILALVCFLIEGLRATLRTPSAPPPNPPPLRLYVGWGWIGLAFVTLSWLVGPGRHILQ